MFKQKKNHLLIVIPDGFKASIKSPQAIPIKNIEEIRVADSSSFEDMKNIDDLLDEGGTITLVHLDISVVDKFSPDAYPTEFANYGELYEYFVKLRAEVNHKARLGYDYASVRITTTSPPNCFTLFYRNDNGKYHRCLQHEIMKPGGLS